MNTEVKRCVAVTILLLCLGVCLGRAEWYALQIKGKGGEKCKLAINEHFAASVVDNYLLISNEEVEFEIPIEELEKMHYSVMPPPVGVQQIESDGSVNPIVYVHSNILQIELPESMRNASTPIMIFNDKGILVLQHECMDTHSISLSDFEKGLYILRIGNIRMCKFLVK